MCVGFPKQQDLAAILLVFFLNRCQIDIKGERVSLCRCRHPPPSLRDSQRIFFAKYHIFFTPCFLFLEEWEQGNLGFFLGYRFSGLGPGCAQVLQSAEAALHCQPSPVQGGGKLHHQQNSPLFKPMPFYFWSSICAVGTVSTYDRATNIHTTHTARHSDTPSLKRASEPPPCPLLPGPGPGATAAALPTARPPLRGIPPRRLPGASWTLPHSPPSLPELPRLCLCFFFSAFFHP